jgi:hypothetical protein
MYGPMPRLKKKNPNQVIRPILIREMVQNNQKTGIFAVFFSILRTFRHPKINQKQYPNKPKWARFMAQYQNFKNEPITKS